MNLNKELSRLNTVIKDVDALICKHEADINFVIENIPSDANFTFIALFTFAQKMNRLQTGIFKIAKARELYTAKSLYRVLLEHFLKGTYIYCWYCNENTDDAGKEYYLYSKAGEDLGLGKSAKAKSSLLNDEFTLDEFKLLKEVHPKLNISDRKSLKLITDKFNIKNIVKYLLENLSEVGNECRDYLGNILLAYSDLSSFIHGGPTAEKYLFLCNTKEITDELIKICEMTTGLTVAMHTFTYLVYAQENDNLHPLCVELSKLQKSIS